MLITPTQIARRVKALARSIQQDSHDSDLVVVPLLNGTVLFVADLLRQLTLPLELDFLGISSYRHNKSPGRLVITKPLRADLRGRDVLVVDDILDSGQTLSHTVRELRKQRPRRIRICVLLEKQVPRRHRVRPHYIGFQIPNEFVVGYGLDYAERYRNLPFIGVLKATP